MKGTYTLKLHAFQIEILMETVAGFVDNKKLLHIPDHEGKIVSLPLTMEALSDIKSVMDRNEDQEPMEIHITMDHGASDKIKLSMQDSVFEYDVNFEEFDPV